MRKCERVSTFFLKNFKEIVPKSAFCRATTYENANCQTDRDMPANHPPRPAGVSAGKRQI
jgi:hypothetical protein